MGRRGVLARNLHIQTNDVGRVVGHQPGYGFPCGLAAPLVDDPVVTQFVRLRESLAAHIAAKEREQTCFKLIRILD